MLFNFFKSFSRHWIGQRWFSMSHLARKQLTCTMIPGDGVGPELMQGIKEVVQVAKIPVKFDEVDITEVGPNSAPLKDAVESIKRNKVCLCGPLSIPEKGSEKFSLRAKLRKSLNLFAGVYKIKTLPGAKTPLDDVDIIIVQEQLEGEYTSLEHETVPGVVEHLKITTRKNSIRIAKFAFEYAIKKNREKVTSVHKANIMKLTDGLFLHCCREVAKEFANVKFASVLVDAATMHLVYHPDFYDVMVTGSLYGSVISHIGAGLIGGEGFVSKTNYSPTCNVYESVVASSKDSEGCSYNPSGAILNLANMLRSQGLDKHSKKLESTLMNLLRSGTVKTREMGGNATTSQFFQAYIDALSGREC